MYDEKKHLKENDSVLIEFEHNICFSKIQVDLHSSQIEYCSFQNQLHMPLIQLVLSLSLILALFIIF